METRLAILAEAGVIDEDIHQAMRKVTLRLEKHWQLPVRTEQGTLALTHLANAIMRARRGEVIQGIDDELRQELESLETFPMIFSIHQDVMAHFPLAVPEYEVGYLLVNLAAMYEGKAV
ncbi:PRD domain-containing protein [Rouxiella sp. Mn2063]|uniref:PRD domain-containing protein n=1 Tax=Rouxiella sp. Mn2063 TaxID=3395262 RepID=UPI003BD29A64